MNKFLKLWKSLMAKGFATASEKAELNALHKELPEDEQETVKEDVENVDALPETDPKAEEETDEAVKQIQRSIATEVKSQVDAAKKEMNTEMQKFVEKNKTAVKQNSIDAILNDEGLKSFAKNIKSEQGSTVIELKDFELRQKVSVAGDISIADDFSGTASLSDVEPGVAGIAKRQPFIEELVSVGTINSMLDVWIEVANEAGAPLPKAELAALPQKEWDFIERSRQVRKIGVFAKYSAEMAEDLPNVISEVKNFLVQDLRLEVDRQILAGSGSGENLYGILQTATAYSAGSFADSVLEPNHFDVIETAVTQVMVALFNPNYAVLHPVDVAKMNLAKASDGHYVLPPFISSGGQIVSGVRIIANTAMTVDNFLVGDFTRSSVKYRRGLTVEVTNTDQDDFIKDRFTVKATVRLVHRVKENDYGAFVKGTFAAAITALEVGS